jgi:DNA-binding NarL/FixJ family response regulator
MQPSEFSELKEPLERIAKILAGLLLRDIEEGDQKQKVKRLKQCGFENTEIAKMLGTTPNTVGVAVHSLKKKKKKTKARPRKNKKKA